MSKKKKKSRLIFMFMHKCAMNKFGRHAQFKKTQSDGCLHRKEPNIKFELDFILEYGAIKVCTWSAIIFG
jgi:hypothetical protein